MEKIEKLGVQLYTVREHMKNEQDIAETFKRLKDMGYDQGQTAWCAVPYEVFGELAEKAGIEIVGTHEAFDLICEDFDLVFKRQQALHTMMMGIGSYFSKEEQRNITAAEEFIKKANAIGEKMAQYGGKFTYHNHHLEFMKLENGKMIMEMLADGLNPKTTSFVLDTYWVQNGGGEICDWIERLSGRIDILHLKDGLFNIDEKKIQITEIGNGNMNWERIISCAQKNGVKTYVVEQDFPEDAFKSLKISSDYIHKNFM